MKNLKKGMVLVLISLAIVIGSQTSTLAITMTLSLWDHINPVVTTDDSAMPGYVSINQALGDWKINVTTGLDYSDPAGVKLHLNSIDKSVSKVNSVLPEHLTITLVYTSFYPTITSTLNFEWGGTTPGTEYFSAYNNSTDLFSSSPLGPYSGAFSDSTSYLSVLSPYTLTLVVDIYHGAGTNVSSFDFDVKGTGGDIPEPGTLVLLGTGLLGLGIVVRRRKK